jgi:hypothetical protein
VRGAVRDGDEQIDAGNGARHIPCELDCIMRWTVAMAGTIIVAIAAGWIIPQRSETQWTRRAESIDGSILFIGVIAAAIVSPTVWRPQD